MAYTYNDFVTAATNAGMMDQFDTNDIDMAKKYPEYGLSMVSLKRDLGNAKTNEQQLLANEAINQLRKNYGSYWTGDSGNRTYAASYGSKISDTMDRIKNYGDFKYSSQDQYKKLLDQAANREEFSWNPEKDELFSDYKKTYLREGDRAAADALAQAASATGGNISSFAQQAAQQGANYWAGKLADAIPALRAQRFGEYTDNFNMLLNSIGQMSADRDNEYRVWGDKLAQLQQVLTNYQNQDKSDYARYLDMVNAEYQRERDAVADAEKELQNALTIYQLTGQATGALKDMLAAAGLGTAAGGGSSGGGWSGSGVSKDLQDQANQVVAEIFRNSNAKGEDNLPPASNANVYRGIANPENITPAQAMGGNGNVNTGKTTASTKASQSANQAAKRASSSGSGKAVTSIKALGA